MLVEDSRDPDYSAPVKRRITFNQGLFSNFLHEAIEDNTT